MLDTLSNSLKNTLKKIANALFLNERLLDELLRDIQRALLQADVNVQLVFDLTKKIKERALAEKTSGAITQREHLVTIVYEELVTFFGKEKKVIALPSKHKPFKIMMVGLYGAGKCVHKDSKIPLSDGNIVSAEELYASYRHDETGIDDGFIIDVTNKNLLVPSFNPQTLKIESKKVTYLWKLQGKGLLRVSLENGNDFNVHVTPEHPFFVLRNGMLKQVRADALTEDDFVAIPTRYTLSTAQQSLLPALKSLDLNVKHKLDLSNRSILYDILPTLKFKRNYCHLTMDLNREIIPISLIETFSADFLTLRLKGSRHFITFPTSLTEELAEFLGYVFGDGHLDPCYVEITNEDPEIIRRVCSLADKLFQIKAKVRKDERTAATYRLRFVSVTLVTFFNKIFGIPIGKKGKKLSVSPYILKSPPDVVRAFLRAYFDCDSSCSRKGRFIELSSESRFAIQDVATLLHRFGILSTVSRKIIHNIPYWRLTIGARYAEIYASLIGFTVSHKKERAGAFSLIGMLQGCGKQEMIPLSESLRTLRNSLGFSIGEIQHYVSSYGVYEATGAISKESLAGVIALYLLKRKGNIAFMLEALYNSTHKSFNHNFINGFLPYLRREGLIHEQEGTLLLTEKAFHYLEDLGKHQHHLEFFKSLVSSDVGWARVTHVAPIPYIDYVYDLTVEDNHSFIADNIIVHNTTTSGKLAKYYAQRGQKVALVGLDVHRPAAPQQLQQLADQLHVPCYINPKEKNPLAIWKQYSASFSQYDLLIIDTAGRDALSDDLIKEIEAVHKIVQADENFLVLSADIGQAAQQQAKQFHQSCGVTGIIVTKLDGTAKGGGSLSACATTGAPIVFIGVGEKVDDLEEFNPTGFVSRLLGMGDLEALLEKAKASLDETKTEDLSKRMLEGDFNFLDLFEQLQSMKKLGPLHKIMDLIPGMGGVQIPKEMLSVQEDKLEKWKYIMNSCTKEELEHPDILTRTRIDRIAQGAGVSVKDVRELLKQYQQSKKMFKMMKGKNPEKLMKQFGKMNMK